MSLKPIFDAGSLHTKIDPRSSDTTKWSDNLNTITEVLDDNISAYRLQYSTEGHKLIVA